MLPGLEGSDERHVPLWDTKRAASGTFGDPRGRKMCLGDNEDDIVRNHGLGADLQCACSRMQTLGRSPNAETGR